MKELLNKVKTSVAAGLLVGAAIMPATASADTIRIALAEPPSDELAAFFVALDRAEANGLEYEWTAFSDEELAIQAVLSGQMDIGFGTPYAAMQRSRAPIRIIYQLSRLLFFPVTTTDYNSLEDLDGEPILLHSRGGGTDSIANIIETRLGIEFGERSYVPGSSNRVAALLGGQAQATIIDLGNTNRLMRSPAASDFNVLEMFEVTASDEAIFGNFDWIQENPEDVQIFIDALVSVYHDMHEDPTIIRRETNPDGPIGQLPEELLAEFDQFYTDAVEAGLYDVNGGGREAATADLEWYSAAGQLEGDPAEMDIEDFWYFAPLDAAMQ